MAQAEGLARNARLALIKYLAGVKQKHRPYGWRVIQVKDVPELGLMGVELEHKATDARLVHVAREDPNNVFSIGFRTRPPDNSGVPHILEHTTLCGSEKFPVRDPFFKMLPRTLSNFMNAFTASDHTYYPFATTNPQDYRNLASVYLDATLHPLLRRNDFLQEGWRIGPVNPQALLDGGKQATDEDRKLVFKGVVYNEMKGQMSDADYYFYVKSQEALFPDLHNSGGDPAFIPRLTHQSLKDFHRFNYRSNNLKLFTYGNIPMHEHLEMLDTAFAELEVPTRRMKPWRAEPLAVDFPKTEVRFPGPLDPLNDPDKQVKCSLTWRLGSTHEPIDDFGYGLLSSLLMDGYGSPLYKGLIESGLGTDWTPNSGYDGSHALGTFTIGLSGLRESDVPRFESEVYRILAEASERRFDKDKIDGYLHQLEIAVKHKSAGVGLALLQKVMPRWLTAWQNPLHALAWREVIDKFMAKMAKREGLYINDLLRRYLVHPKAPQVQRHLAVTMVPSADFGAELQEAEADRLERKIEKVAKEVGGREKAQEHFVAQELELLAAQQAAQKEEADCLPTVRVSDIPAEKKRPTLRETSVAGAQVQWHETATNGLTYFRAFNRLENLPSELRELLPLFADAVMRLGTKTASTEALEDAIKLKTGGLSVGYHGASRPRDRSVAEEGIMMTGMALDHNVPVMFDLLRQLLVETDFGSDKAVQHIRQLIRTAADGAINDVASEGHAFARRSAEAGLSLAAQHAEEVGGLSQVRLIASLAGRPEAEGLEDVLAKLKMIQKLVCAPAEVRAALTYNPAAAGSDAVAMDHEAALGSFLSDVRTGSGSGPGAAAQTPEATGASPHGPREHRPLSRNIKSFFPLPYQVYYGALALPGQSYTSRDGASLQVLSQLLTHKHLHHEIREKGGAYGGGAYYHPLNGVFGFYSYRDPNPVNTLSIMRAAGQWAADKAWTDRDLEEAKISLFQAIDAPQDVSEEGMNQFLYGIDQDMEQQRRDALLAVDRDGVRDAAHKYLVEGLAAGKERTAFIGEKQAWVDSSWEVEEMGEVAKATAAAAISPDEAPPTLEAESG